MALAFGYVLGLMMVLVIGWEEGEEFFFLIHVQILRSRELIAPFRR